MRSKLASSLLCATPREPIELSKDNLLVAFFAGPYEGHSDTAIYLSYLKQGQNYKLCPLSDVMIKDASCPYSKTQCSVEPCIL